MALLEVEHIKKSFGATKVLKDISFEMQEGTALSIIGSSGSGKTTLLRCLNFLETPNEGIIRVKGKDLLNTQAQRALTDAQIRDNRLHFGLVFQSFNLFPQYTALENVMLAPRLRLKDKTASISDAAAGVGRSEEEIRENALHLLDEMGLSNRMDNYPHQLSGGQQQRVAIARALALKPDILCFDEPTSALDPELTGEVLRVIRELADRHTTMIIVTHEMSFAHDVSDKVIFMDDGQIAEYGTPDEVFEHPTRERTRQFLARYNQSNE